MYGSHKVLADKKQRACKYSRMRGKPTLKSLALTYLKPRKILISFFFYTTSQLESTFLSVFVGITSQKQPVLSSPNKKKQNQKDTSWKNFVFPTDLPLYADHTCTGVQCIWAVINTINVT